jgi:predicted amidohydrolase
LSVGAPADVAAFRLLDGEFAFRDVSGGAVKGRRRLFCELTLNGGAVAWDWNSRGGTDYHEMGPEYGVRDVDTIVRPPK